MARHLNGFGASKEEVVEARMFTIQAVMPSPIKGRFALPEVKNPFIVRYNVATFGQQFKGTFVTRLSPKARGSIIRNTNSWIINKTSRSGIMGLTKKGNKMLHKSVDESKELED